MKYTLLILFTLLFSACSNEGQSSSAPIYEEINDTIVDESEPEPEPEPQPEEPEPEPRTGAGRAGARTNFYRASRV